MLTAAGVEARSAADMASASNMLITSRSTEPSKTLCKKRDGHALGTVSSFIEQGSIFVALGDKFLVGHDPQQGLHGREGHVFFDRHGGVDLAYLRLPKVQSTFNTSSHGRRRQFIGHFDVSVNRAEKTAESPRRFVTAECPPEIKLNY